MFGITLVLMERFNPFKFLEKCNEHLIDGGKLLLLYPDIMIAKFKFYCDYTHKTPVSQLTINQMLHDAKFKIIKEEKSIVHVKGSGFLFQKLLKSPKLHYKFLKFYSRFKWRRTVLANKYK